MANTTQTAQTTTQTNDTALPALMVEEEHDAPTKMSVDRHITQLEAQKWRIEASILSHAWQLQDLEFRLGEVNTELASLKAENVAAVGESQ
jgi:hypothetical protein